MTQHLRTGTNEELKPESGSVGFLLVLSGSFWFLLVLFCSLRFCPDRTKSRASSWVLSRNDDIMDKGRGTIQYTLTYLERGVVNVYSNRLSAYSKKPFWSFFLLCVMTSALFEAPPPRSL
ncbi:hypothetical protein fugu_018802 [Takifugu bimaculatus]|uniref:Uncharacterized protein n=1 Tax=Takifugu bimaculatus TaxID=433685 RepID=A0A4Z2BHE2_9TELE|nr:hypothetical protein fugu_018802 [Takifugu bimaculatus]